MNKIYTMKEIVESLNPIIQPSFSAHTLHLVEEIGEIASVIHRNHDPMLTNTIYEVSEINFTNAVKLFKDKPELKSEWEKLTGFYRWNENIVGNKFKKRLESELADIIMMVAIYPILAKKKYFNYDFKYLYKYKFDKIFKFKRDPALLILYLLHGNIYILDIICKGEPHEFYKIIRELMEILDIIQEFCYLYEIDVNQAIYNKLHKDLKDEKRSKM